MNSCHFLPVIHRISINSEATRSGLKSVCDKLGHNNLCVNQWQQQSEKAETHTLKLSNWKKDTLVWICSNKYKTRKMPRSFLIKKKEKLPRWDRYEPEDVTPIVTPRTVYTPTPSRLEQLAAIVTGSPIHYLPTYPVSPFTPLAVSLANGKWLWTIVPAYFLHRLKTNLRFIICNWGFAGYLWVMCNTVIQILLSVEVLTSRHLIQINHLHICERSCLWLVGAIGSH